LDPLLHTRLQPSSWKFFDDLLPRLDLNSLAFVTPTMEAWSLVERETVIGLYEKFFFQSDVGAYPMFDMPSLIEMPGLLSMKARGKQLMREVHLARDVPVPLRAVLRSAKPEAATSKAKPEAAIAFAAAATKAAAAAVTAATAATKAPPAVGHKGGETKAKQAIAEAKQAIAAEEEAKALEANEVWRRRCSTLAKSYHPFTRSLNSLLESIPGTGKLALQAGFSLTHTRTPAHPHTRTCA
jgi:hypothetical protein